MSTEEERKGLDSESCDGSACNIDGYGFVQRKINNMITKMYYITSRMG